MRLEIARSLLLANAACRSFVSFLHKGGLIHGLFDRNFSCRLGRVLKCFRGGRAFTAGFSHFLPGTGFDSLPLRMNICV